MMVINNSKEISNQIGFGLKNIQSRFETVEDELKICYETIRGYSFAKHYLISNCYAIPSNRIIYWIRTCI